MYSALSKCVHISEFLKHKQASEKQMESAGEDLFDRLMIMTESAGS